MNCFIPLGLTGGHKSFHVIVWLCLLTLVPSVAYAQSLTVTNGNMEKPTVGAWSTTLPGSWTWAVGAGSGNVGLTSTGGANGTQQTFWGNSIAGTLTSAVLPQSLSSPALLALNYPGSTRDDVHAAARLGMNDVAALKGFTQPEILDSEYNDWNDTAQDLAYLGWNASTPPVLAYSQITTNTPVFGAASQTGKAISFGGGGGSPGATYYVLCATNLSMPFTNWTFWDTNQFDAFGNFIITDSPALSQRFYRLLLY